MNYETYKATRTKNCTKCNKLNRGVEVCLDTKVCAGRVAKIRAIRLANRKAGLRN